MSVIFPLHMFVYGTLMKGYSNHYLLDGCKYIGQAKSKLNYALYTQYYPYVNSTQSNVQIYGEVYEIPNMDVLKDLDALEEHPDVYIRTTIDIIILNDSETLIKAEIYFNNRNDINNNTSVESVPSGSFHDSKTADRHRLKIE